MYLMSIEELADIVLHASGASPGLAIYEGEENFTTRVKNMDFSKAKKDLKHDPKIDIHDGVKQYIEWMKKIYV